MGHVVQYTYEGGEPEERHDARRTAPDWTVRIRRLASDDLDDRRPGRQNHQRIRRIQSGRLADRPDGTDDELGATKAFHTTITNKATGAVTNEWFNQTTSPSRSPRLRNRLAPAPNRFTYTAAGLLAEQDRRQRPHDDLRIRRGRQPDERTRSRRRRNEMDLQRRPQVLTETTPNGEKTTIKRDADGNPKTISRPAPGSKTQTVPTKRPHGEVESMTDPLGETGNTNTTATATARPKSTPKATSGPGDTTKTRRELDCQPARERRGRRTGEIHDDDRTRCPGPADQGHRPARDTTKYAYDGDGNVESKTDRTATRRNTPTTPTTSRQRSKAQRDDEETGYDGAGQMISQTDGNGDKTKYARNVLEEPPKSSIRWNGKRSGIRRGRKPQKLTTPKAAPRPTPTTPPTASRSQLLGGTPPDVKYKYDKDGDRTKMTDGTGDQDQRHTTSSTG